MRVAGIRIVLAFALALGGGNAFAQTTLRIALADDPDVLDPKRTIAVDMTGDTAKRITIMMPPGADPSVRDAAAAMFAKSGTKVTAIKDSPGFIAQRMCAMIANLGCEMAMIGIASAADVDTAMTLGLNYPRGPLALADWLGVKDCHEILVQLQAITGDDRYRPSQWLRRRAMLGMSATTVE